MVKHFPASWRSGSALLAFLSSLLDGQGCPWVTAFSAVQGGLDYLVLSHIGTNRFQEWTGDVEYTRWLMQVRLPAPLPLGEPGISWDGFGELQGKSWSVAMVENNPFTSFLFESGTLEALLLERCFAQMLYICEEKCLGRTSDFFLLFFYPPFSPGVKDWWAVLGSCVQFREVSKWAASPSYWSMAGAQLQNTELFEMVSAIWVSVHRFSFPVESPWCQALGPWKWRAVFLIQSSFRWVILVSISFWKEVFHWRVGT